MNKNDELKQSVAECIEAWGVESKMVGPMAAGVINIILAAYRIEPKGMPIRPEDVRKGDRVRAEWTDGVVREFKATGPISSDYPGEVFLLDRPDPDADFEFPDRNGAVIRLTPKDNDSPRTVASRELGNWYIAGIEPSSNEKHLREYWCNFEVLSDGSDQ